jgi:hypothetical protein
MNYDSEADVKVLLIDLSLPGAKMQNWQQCDQSVFAGMMSSANGPKDACGVAKLGPERSRSAIL